MNDGIRGGAKISVRIGDAKADIVRKVMVTAMNGKWDVDTSGELRIPVMDKAMMYLVLRRDIRNHSIWYLNIDGNPLKFLCGNNLYGYTNAEDQIKYVFWECIKAVEAAAKMKMPRSVKQQIKRGEINLNSMEFAAYSAPIRDPKFIINAWRSIFGRAQVTDPETRKNKMLAEMLGVRVRTEFLNSFSVCTVNEQGRNKVMFTAYDKVEEEYSRERKSQNARGEEDEHFLMVAEGFEDKNRVSFKDVEHDLATRIRYDIAFQSAWFSSTGLRTLGALGAHIRKRFGGRWEDFVEFHVKEVVEQACLLDMWRFKHSDVIEGFERGDKEFNGRPIEAYVAMAEARREKGFLTIDNQVRKLKGDKEWWTDWVKRGGRLPKEEVQALGVDKSKLSISDIKAL